MARRVLPGPETTGVVIRHGVNMDAIISELDRLYVHTLSLWDGIAEITLTYSRV